ncbi:expressed unknown protein [Seminavis robusta]|uniref:AB hydrolase-1 domain-containing protein n=1 Tax=Seminavis robusta TaxID=568900 RepID=A0A9N8HEE6_9STRA|nr:expressed unknown protein [Seminavis robusta]|eukprot:Sro403_g135560.2  (383) ;mRNA; r:2354-3582
MSLPSHYLLLLFFLLTLSLSQGQAMEEDSAGQRCLDAPPTLELSDGRTLAYCEFGASAEEATAVVLHCNGSGGSRLEWPGNEELLKELGIRFITVDRPGHGFSDPVPDGRTLLDWPRTDVTQLLDHISVDQFYIEGWSAGGSYALAVAHEFGNSGRVLGGAILSGIGPFDRPNPFEGMDEPQIRMWMEWARDQNETAILEFRGQLAPFLQASNASQIGMLLGSGGVGLDDLEVARRPDLQTLMGGNIKEGYRQGAPGPAQDDLVINRPWEFRLQDINPMVHIDVWQGEIDQNVPLNQWEEILVKLVAPSSALSTDITQDADEGEATAPASDNDEVANGGNLNASASSGSRPSLFGLSRRFGRFVWKYNLVLLLLGLLIPVLL